MKFSFIEKKYNLNKNINRINESKQVGILYHICSLDALANYIAPRDTLQGSGKYYNWLLKGNSDIVSFTRDKNFIIQTSSNLIDNVIFQIEVDGNKLSEKYKIIPYNDFHWDYSGIPQSEYDAEKDREKEEVIEGAIHPLSKYIKKIWFDIKGIPSILNKENWDVFLDKLMMVYNYIKQFPVQQNIKIFKDINLDDRLIFSSFEELIRLTKFIVNILNGKQTNVESFKKVIKLIPINLRSELLEYALTENLYEVVNVLFKNTTKENKEKILNRAIIMAINSYSDENTRILIKLGADINKTDNYGKTRLHKAAGTLNLKKMKFLLEHGINVNAQDNNGNTALIYAIKKGSKDAVKLLLDQGADANLGNYSGLTPFLKCLKEADGEILDLLIQNGVDINQKDEDGVPYVLKAITSNNLELLEFLLEHGADVNSRDEYSATILMWVTRLDNPDLVKLVLDYGADVNAKNEEGETALNDAVLTDNPELVELLLEHGAEVNEPNAYGDTVLDIAIGLENENIVKLLKKYGAEASENF